MGKVSIDTMTDYQLQSFLTRERAAETYSTDIHVTEEKNGVAHLSRVSSSAAPPSLPDCLDSLSSE